MRMTRDRHDPDLSRGDCDACGAEVTRYRGEGDIQCSCGANYNCFGQRLRDDLRTRINPSSYDEDIDDLTGDELSYLAMERE
jgi:hypothetical protein